MPSAGSGQGLPPLAPPSPPSSRLSLRLQFPQCKKSLANFRFLLFKSSASAPACYAAVFALGVLLPAALLLSLSHRRDLINAPFTTYNAAHPDPCSQAVPAALVQFDPSSRASREFSAFVRRDVDPPTYNRIFTTFFDKFLFEPSSDVIVNLNATARGRPTDIRNGLRDAELALRRFYNDWTLRVTKYSLAYDHLDRVRGSRNVLHLDTRNDTHSDLRHSVAIQRLFDGTCHISVREYPLLHYKQPVYIILPYSRRPRRLRWFLDQLQYLKTVADVQVRLVIAVYDANVDDVAQVRTMAVASRVASDITVVEVRGDRMSFFSRAVAIREAVARGGLPDDALMFISDVDMYIFPTMFDSCRMNSIRGSQVYFPVFYSLYARNDRIAKSGGYWRSSSLGMSCMYKSDFQTLAPYDDAETRFLGWGMEDLALSDAFKNDPRYEVFRAVEPALRHKWHLKHCEPLTSAYEDCLAVTFQQLGDMKSVGRFLLENRFDAQKFYAKYADEFEDEKYGGVVVDDDASTKDPAELERRRLRKEKLEKEKEESRKKEIEREKVREAAWRKKTGITKEVEEEMFRKQEAEAAKAFGVEDEDDDEKDRLEDIELMKHSEENEKRLEEERNELHRISNQAGGMDKPR